MVMRIMQLVAATNKSWNKTISFSNDGMSITIKDKNGESKTRNFDSPEKILKRVKTLNLYETQWWKNIQEKLSQKILEGNIPWKSTYESPSKQSVQFSIQKSLSNNVWNQYINKDSGDLIGNIIRILLISLIWIGILFYYIQ